MKPLAEIPALFPSLPEVAAALVREFPAVDCPLQHTFTPGLYSRTIFMPAGSAIVSKKHRTEHQYAILSGRCEVWLPDTGWVMLTAPHLGITAAGTQRVLKVHEDTIWTTFHPTAETDLELIETLLIEPPPVAELETNLTLEETKL